MVIHEFLKEEIEMTDRLLKKKIIDIINREEAENCSDDKFRPCSECVTRMTYGSSCCEAYNTARRKANKILKLFKGENA